MYVNIKKNIIKILVILALFFAIGMCFFNLESFAANTTEITIKYLDEDGNTIKQEEKKQIEMGNESITKYASSYEKIENGTNLFPDKISGYIIQSANIKTYYNGEYRENGLPDEWGEHFLIEHDRIAIINPKSTDLYIVEFIYKKDNTVGNVGQQENVEVDKEKIETEKDNQVSNNENLNTDNNLVSEDKNNMVQDNSTTNNSIPKAGRSDIIFTLVLLVIIAIVISAIKSNTYKDIK